MQQQRKLSPLQNNTDATEAHPPFGFMPNSSTTAQNNSWNSTAPSNPSINSPPNATNNSMFPGSFFNGQEASPQHFLNGPFFNASNPSQFQSPFSLQYPFMNPFPISQQSSPSLQQLESFLLQQQQPQPILPTFIPQSSQPQTVQDIENALKQMLSISSVETSSTQQVTKEIPLSQLLKQFEAISWDGSKAHRSFKFKEFCNSFEEYCANTKKSFKSVWTELLEQGNFSNPDLAHLSKQINKLYQDLLPTTREIERKQEFFKRMNQYIQNRFEGAELKIFGSSNNYLCIKGSSDIDLCLVIDVEKFISKRKKPKANKGVKKTVYVETTTTTATSNVHSAEEQMDSEELLTYDEYLQGKKPTKDSSKLQPTTTVSEQQQQTSTVKEKVIDISELEKQFLAEEEEEHENYPKLSEKVKQERQHKRIIVHALANFLEKLRMKHIKTLPHARIPIVKFYDDSFKLNCDIGVNNMLAIQNTKLLKDYARIDRRFPQMVFIVKNWAKARDINEPYLGGLSSYCYVLMIIHYLQQIRVLPVLQDCSLYPSESIKEEKINYESEGLEYNCSYYQDIPTCYDQFAEIVNKNQYSNTSISQPISTNPTIAKQVGNHDSIGKIVVGFFKYYALEFDYLHQVASIKTKQMVSKEEKKWTNPKQQRNYLCVEDPFEVDFNVARSVSEESIYDIRYEMTRAFVKLSSHKEWKEVSQKITK